MMQLYCNTDTAVLHVPVTLPTEKNAIQYERLSTLYSTLVPCNIGIRGGTAK